LRGAGEDAGWCERRLDGCGMGERRTKCGMATQLFWTRRRVDFWSLGGALCAKLLFVTWRLMFAGAYEHHRELQPFELRAHRPIRTALHQGRHFDGFWTVLVDLESLSHGVIYTRKRLGDIHP
jgi:hypothetical protein